MVDTAYDGVVSVEYEAHFFAKGYNKDPVGSATQSKEFLCRVLQSWLQPAPGPPASR